MGLAVAIMNGTYACYRQGIGQSVDLSKQEKYIGFRDMTDQGIPAKYIFWTTTMRIIHGYE